MTQIEILNGKRKGNTPLPPENEITEWRWVEEVREPYPQYDIATQKLQRKETITESQLIVGWDIVPLTQAEIDNRAQIQARQDFIDAGFATGINGVYLGLDQESQLYIMQLLIFGKFGQLSDTTKVKIKDKEGVLREVNWSVAEPILKQYMQYIFDNLLT